MLVCVAGGCSRSGKTALAEGVIRACPDGVAAVKFTTTDDVFERCPRGTPCVVCDIDVPFRIVRDPAVLAQAGSDTARLGEAGADRVVWAIAKRGAVAAAWQAVQGETEGADCVVIEGSTIVATARPDVVLFVAHPQLSPERWKETSDALIARADLVVVNRPANDPRPPAAEVELRLARAGGTSPRVVADVRRPLSEWAPALAARLAGAGASRAAS